jgi:hypothetical protein
LLTPASGRGPTENSAAIKPKIYLRGDGGQSKSSPSNLETLDSVTRFRTLRIGNPLRLSGAVGCVRHLKRRLRSNGVNIARRKIRFIEPMLTLAITRLPEGPARAYELKFRRLSRAGREGGRPSSVVLAQRQGVHSTVCVDRAAGKHSPDTTLSKVRSLPLTTTAYFVRPVCVDERAEKLERARQSCTCLAWFRFSSWSERYQPG